MRLYRYRRVMTSGPLRLLYCVVSLIAFTTILSLRNTMLTHTVPVTGLQRLSNQYGYRILRNNVELCSDKQQTYVVVFICSKPTNFKRRTLIRETWGKVSVTGGKKVASVFLLGKAELPPKKRKMLNRESNTYGDIIQYDFEESYYNLTMKTVLGLKWSINYCPKATFVMKTDDDMFVNYHNLVRYLKALSKRESEYLYVGDIHHKKSPIREAKGDDSWMEKWIVPKSEYPGNVYPPYAGGSGYVLAMEAAMLIYQEALRQKPLRMEDVFVGVCANNSGVNVTDYLGFSGFWYEFSDCRFNYLITTHGLPLSDRREFWKKVNDKQFEERVQNKTCPNLDDLINYFDKSDEEILNITSYMN